MPDSSKPRSIKSITWKWKWYQLKLKWEKREQQLLFFYPDNEVTIITLVFFFIFSLQLCHSFYNFFTILQFRKQFHYSDKTALNIGTTPFPFHVFMFTFTMFSTCARSPVLALALGQLTMRLCNSTYTWSPAPGPALALALPLATCATLALPLALVHQNLPIAWRTHHLHSCLARITGNISLLRGNPWDLRLVFFKEETTASRFYCDINKVSKQMEWLSSLKQPPILAQSVPGRAPRVQEEMTTDQAPG